MELRKRKWPQSWLYALLLALFIGFSGNSYGQEFYKIIDQAEGRDFQEVVNEVEKLFEGKDKGEEGEYEQFQRWVEFNRSRLTKDGKIQNVAKMLLEESQKYDNYLRTKGKNASRIAANTASWTSIGATSRVMMANGYTGGMGRVNVVVADPSNVNIIYVGTPAGGLWRSTNGGSTWTCLTESLPNVIGVSGIAIDPTSSATNRTIYFLSGDGDGGHTQFTGIYKSTTNGASWTNIGPTGMGISNGRKLVIHPTNNQILFAVTHQGIFKSTTAGSSWSLVKSGYFYDLEFKPGTPSTIYASNDGGVFISNDTGGSWSPLTTGLPTSVYYRTILAVSAAQPNYLYVLYGGIPEAGMYQGLYRSTTGGASFSQMSNTPNILGYDDNGADADGQMGYDLALAVSPANADEVHVGGINCWKSTTGGATWTRTSKWGGDFAPPGDYTHADIHDLAFFGATLFCGSDGGVFKSTNNAGDWADISAGLQISQIYRIGCDPNSTDKTVCGLQDNGVNYIKNQTLYAWQGADGTEAFASTTNSSLMFGSTQEGGLLKSVDNGLTVKGIKPPNTDKGDWVTPFLLDPVKPATLYTGFYDVFRSDNEGKTWTNISNGTIGTYNCNHIAVSPSNTSYIYVAKGSDLYRTTDGGAHWSNISNYSVTGYINDIEVHPTNSEILYLATGNGVVKATLTTNSWVTIAPGTLPAVTINTIAYDKTSSDNSLYIGTDLGVYYKNDALTSWIPFSDGLMKIIVKDIEIHYATRTLRAGTFGRGAWKTPLYDVSGIQVAITSPGLDSNFYQGNSLTISASASVTTGSISKVEFYNGATKLGEDATAPYTYTFSSLAIGNYQITAKAYSSGGASLTSNEVGFRVWKLRVPENPAGTVSGLDYKYYEGTWDYLPDFSTLTAVKTGTETGFNLTQRNTDDYFGFSFKGFINVATDGVYTFYTSSDDGSRLYIGDSLLVDNDGLHGANTEAARIALKAGTHAITVTYFEQGGDESLSVLYSGPGIQKQVIPATVLFRSTGSSVTVTLTSPVNNSTYTAPANVSLAASTQDPQATVTKVEFYKDGTTPVKLGEDLTAPYTYAYNSLSAGEYYVYARAIAGTQVVATSSTVHFTVSAGNLPPTVSITSPANNATFAAPASITIAANASDSDGSVSKVEFYNGSQLLGTDNTAPYSFVWSNVGAGAYTLKAIAYDNLLATGTSSNVSVTVSTSSTCVLSEPMPAASNYVVRNDWGDQGAGSGVTNENSALKVTHRAWGKNELWVIRTAATFAITSGQTYTIKFDFQDSPSYVISGVDVGFATGINSSNNGPALVQAVVAAPSGYSSSSFTTKTVNITASYTGNVNLVFRLRWASQPTSQVVDYIKNVSVCLNQAFPLIASITDEQPDPKLLVLPNPAEFEFLVRTEKYISIMKVTNSMGQEVYSTSDILEGTDFSFGRDFTPGIYSVYVKYGDGSEGKFKLSKAR